MALPCWGPPAHFSRLRCFLHMPWTSCSYQQTLRHVSPHVYIIVLLSRQCTLACRFACIKMQPLEGQS